MSWLTQLDLTLYRAIHVDLRREWLDPIAVVLTQSGLGHVQFSALLLACLPPRRRWVAPTLASAVLAAGFLVPPWQQMLPYQILVNGFGLAVLGMFAVSALQMPLSRFAVAPLIAGIVSGIVRLGLVRLIDRQRPSNLAISQPLESAFGNSSFPSGHATTSFAIAFSLLFLTWRTDASWLGWLALTWAGFVGLSRVYVGVHWPSDIVAAAGLGLACAAAVHLAWTRAAQPAQENPGC